MILRLTFTAVLLSVMTSLGAPRLTSPENESTLSGSSVRFEWTADTSAVYSWHLAVGSSQGGYDYFTKGFGTSARSVTVTGLPVDGSGIFARLFYMLLTDERGFRFAYTDYTFSTPLPAPPALTVPAPGSVLPDETVTFQWEDRGTLATSWRLQVGSTVGGAEYRDATVGASLRSLEVTGLPADGSRVWVRFNYLFGGIWRHVDYDYTAKITSATPVITSPGPGGAVSSVPFVAEWSPSLSVVEKWQVLVATAQGGAGILDTGEVDATVRSATVESLPEGTTTFWIRLRYQIAGTWGETDFQYSYDPEGDAVPQVFSPNPGREIVGAQARFQWTAKQVNVEEWWIYIGYAEGGSQILNRNTGTATSVTVNNLPTNGETLYVRLFYRVGETWNQRDHLYTTRRLPKLTFPAPGTLISGSFIKFEWVDNDILANAWAISVGTSQGASDILESDTLAADRREQEVYIPATVDGDVWVRLWHLPNSLNWNFVDFLYEIQGPTTPALLEPAPGSSFRGGTTKRLHFAANDATLYAYWVYVGSTVGARDIFNSGFIDDSVTFADLTDVPNEDATIHVRLWWLVNVNRWQWADYTLRVVKADSPSLPTPGGSITPP